jgi:hypothetical protein
LIGDFKPFASFTTFDPDDLPTNSDVVMVLAQYVASVLEFRKANTTNPDGSSWFWRLDGKTSKIETDSWYEFRYEAK